MNRTFAWIALLAPLAVAPAHASPELAAKSKCMSCHSVDKKMLGPSFNDISAKYKMGLGCGKDDAAAMLTESILKGTKNKWGKIPMPPQKIPAEDAKTLAKWILAC
ncbi:MAG: c-type cytochrome [Gammaproteobacteria bacterium]